MMAHYGARGVAYSPRQSNVGRPVDGYSSPSYASYRDTSNMSRMCSPSEQHAVYRDARQNNVRSHETNYSSQEYSGRSTGMMGARKELPFRKSASSDHNSEFISIGGHRPPGVDLSGDCDEYQNDRIRNTLLDEICSDYGIKDSIELDLFNLDTIYPKMSQIPDQGEVDQMIPFGALEADAELKNSKEGHLVSKGSSRMGTLTGGPGKVMHDEQIMPPPASAGAVRRGGGMRNQTVMMNRGVGGVGNVYQQQAMWSNNSNMGYMAGKQVSNMTNIGGMGMNSSGGNWGSDIIEAVASPTISSSCESEQKPTPPCSMPDSTNSGIVNSGSGITAVHSTTSCNSTSATGAGVTPGGASAVNATDEDKSAVGEVLSDAGIKTKVEVKSDEKEVENDVKSNIQTVGTDVTQPKFSLSNDGYKATSGSVAGQPPASSAAVASQVSSAATSASTSPSQMHAAKKQRTSINTGSDLLEEVRECFAYVHGADMFSVPNQHPGFGNPMFPGSDSNSSMPNVYNNVNNPANYGYCNSSTGQPQNQARPGMSASKEEGVYSGTTQGYGDGCGMSGPATQKFRDYAQHGGQYQYNMQQQTTSAPCTPSKQHGGEGYGMWSNQMGTPNSHMSQSRSLASTRQQMSAAAAEYGDSERQMYGSHPILNRTGSTRGDGSSQVATQFSSNSSQTVGRIHSGSTENQSNATSYTGAIKIEPPQSLTKVQPAPDNQRVGSPYRGQSAVDQSEKLANQSRQMYQQQSYQLSQHQNVVGNQPYQNPDYYNQQRQQYNSQISDQYQYQNQQLPYNCQQPYQQLPASYQQTYQQQQQPCDLRAPGMPGMARHLDPTAADMSAQSSHIPLSEHSFLRRLISGDASSKVYRQHSLFPLLRDLIIADMNFHTPTFPFRLIANLPIEFSKLIFNYQARNPGLVLEHPEHTVHRVVMDAVKYAHAALIGKIQSRKASEGYVDRPRQNMDDFCNIFEQSVKRTNMTGYQAGDDFSRSSSPSIKHLPPPNTYDPTSPQPRMTSQDPPSISRSPSLPSLPYSPAPPGGGETGYMTHGSGGDLRGFVGEDPAGYNLPPYHRSGSCGMMPSDAVGMAHRAVGYDMMPPSSPSSLPYGMNYNPHPHMAGSPHPHMAGSPHPHMAPPHMYYMGGMTDRMHRGGVHSLPSSPRKLQYRSMADMGLVPGGAMVGGEKAGKNKVLPKEAVNVMLEWLREHQENPYPNDDEKESLIETTKLTMNQINYWFTNARRRILPKWALQRHLAEQEKARQKSGSGRSVGSDDDGSGRSGDKSRDNQSMSKDLTFISSPDTDVGDVTYDHKPHIKSECRDVYGRVECDTTA